MGVTPARVKGLRVMRDERGGGMALFGGKWVKIHPGLWVFFFIVKALLWPFVCAVDGVRTINHDG